VGWHGDALGRLGGALWRLGSARGVVWGVLEPSWNGLNAVLEASWKGLWGVFGRPRASWYLFGASTAPFSYQTEALRLGCHLVLDFYSFELGFFFDSNMRESPPVLQK